MGVGDSRTIRYPLHDQIPAGDFVLTVSPVQANQTFHFRMSVVVPQPASSGCSDCIVSETPIGEADAGGTGRASATITTAALQPPCGAELRVNLRYADGPAGAFADAVTGVTTP